MQSLTETVDTIINVRLTARCTNDNGTIYQNYISIV